MSSALWAVFFILLICVPFASIVYLVWCWNRYKETIPFTPENDKTKKRLILAAIIAGVCMTLYLTIMAIYGVKVYFA